VAAALGIALGTVKSQTRHALGRLRTLAPELRDLVEVSSGD
jgi:DNA-directed RNA polymerase specialized sigma24 family protein